MLLRISGAYSNVKLDPGVRRNDGSCVRAESNALRRVESSLSDQPAKPARGFVVGSLIAIFPGQQCAKAGIQRLSPFCAERTSPGPRLRGDNGLFRTLDVGGLPTGAPPQCIDAGHCLPVGRLAADRLDVHQRVSASIWSYPACLGRSHANRISRFGSIVRAAAARASSPPYSICRDLPTDSRAAT